MEADNIYAWHEGWYGIGTCICEDVCESWDLGRWQMYVPMWVVACEKCLGYSMGGIQLC